MAPKSFYYLLLFVFIVSLCHGQKRLVWEEQFDGSNLDKSSWNFELGDGCPHLCGWGNNEKQFYTDQNYQVKDGFFTISAKLNEGKYTSTKITTKGKKEFQYGKIEVRAKLPKGKGIWPAAWMLGSNIDEAGWPLCGEIDILEYVGRLPETIFTTLHTADSHGNSKNTKKEQISGIEEGFHIYAIDWNKDRIEFYIDQQLFYTFRPEEKNIETWPFDQPFYLILNMAVGGHFGGKEIDNSIFPQSFIIDYIKVFQ